MLAENTTESHLIKKHYLKGIADKQKNLSNMNQPSKKNIADTYKKLTDFEK